MARPGDEDFLGRWSRRKRGEGSDDHETPTPKPAESVIPDAESEEDGDPEVIAQLPDIEGMDDSSDFTVFLKAGVPEALRRRALRKLWRVNPVLANLDGLNDYDEDYTKMSALGRGMKTLYQVGEGYATDESDVAAEDVAVDDVVAADGEPPSDATDDPETRPPELPSPNESELPTAALSKEPNLVESRVRGPVKSTRNAKGAASSRRWGTQKKPS